MSLPSLATRHSKPHTAGAYLASFESAISATVAIEKRTLSDLAKLFAAAATNASFGIPFIRRTT